MVLPQFLASEALNILPLSSLLGLRPGGQGSFPAKAEAEGPQLYSKPGEEEEEGHG